MPIDTTPAALDEILRTAFERFPTRCAVADASRELTYAELDDHAVRVAHGLLRLGGRPGDRVLLLAHNCCEWLEVDVALALSGLTRVAVSPRLHPNEVAQIAEDAEPLIAIVDAQWLADAGRGWIPSSVKHVVTIGGETPGATPFDELTTQNDGELPPVDPDGIAWLSYTSGSTGLPKGVPLTPRNVAAMLRNIRGELPQIGHEDVAALTAPLAHFTNPVAHTMFGVGASNVLHSSFDVDALIDAVEHGGVTVLPLVPTQITMVTAELERRAAEGRPTDVSGVKTLLYAGSAIPPDRLSIARRLFGNVLVQFYGTAEAPMPLTALHPDDHTGAHDDGGLPRLASAGRPTANVELRIAGPDGAPLPAGQVGSIIVRGDHVTHGYWRKPQETSAVLDADGWFKTGDLGYLDGAGFLFIVDREKDMVVTGGFNVYPREVENAISTLAGIREVAVVGAPSERWGEELVAVVSLARGASISEADVMHHCRAQIAGYKVPKQVRIVEDLPKGGTGKILKRVIRDELWAGHERRV